MDSCPPLFKACKEKDLVTVRKLLKDEKTEEVNEVGEKHVGFTPLFVAMGCYLSTHGVPDIDLFREMLRHPKIDVNKASPLFFAATYLIAQSTKPYKKRNQKRILLTKQIIVDLLLHKNIKVDLSYGQPTGKFLGDLIKEWKKDPENFRKKYSDYKPSESPVKGYDHRSHLLPKSCLAGVAGTSSVAFLSTHSSVMGTTAATMNSETEEQRIKRAMNESMLSTNQLSEEEQFQLAIQRSMEDTNKTELKAKDTKKPELKEEVKPKPKLHEPSGDKKEKEKEKEAAFPKKKDVGRSKPSESDVFKDFGGFSRPRLPRKRKKRTIKSISTRVDDVKKNTGIEAPKHQTDDNDHHEKDESVSEKSSAISEKETSDESKNFIVVSSEDNEGNDVSFSWTSNGKDFTFFISMKMELIEWVKIMVRTMKEKGEALKTIRLRAHGKVAPLDLEIEDFFTLEYDADGKNGIIEVEMNEKKFCMKYKEKDNEANSPLTAEEFNSYQVSDSSDEDYVPYAENAF